MCIHVRTSGIFLEAIVSHIQAPATVSQLCFILPYFTWEFQQPGRFYILACVRLFPLYFTYFWLFPHCFFFFLKIETAKE